MNQGLDTQIGEIPTFVKTKESLYFYSRMEQLSKGDKKILRVAIDIGLQKDYVTAIEAMDAVITQWKEKQLDNRHAYSALYSAMKEHDKFIARRYDSVTGSHYLTLVSVLYAEDNVTDEDLAGLSEEPMETIRRFKKFRANV